MLWNNWLWARQGFEDYAILVFDFVASKNFGFTRFPICFIQDKDGNLIFQNTRDVSYEVLEKLHDDTSGKDYPKVSRYTFEHDGTHVTYTLSEDKVLESRGGLAQAPAMIRARLGKPLAFSSAASSS